jgi:predicted dehydrogenase
MIRVGVVGYGSRISGFIKGPLRKISPNVRIIGIVDPDEKGAHSRLDDCDKESVKFYKNLKEMVLKAKLDALFIGTRCNLHTPLATEAAGYDIPLFLEKPVSVSMKQALELEEAFTNSSCPVLVSFPLKVSPLFLKTKEIIANGSIGKPEHILATNYVNYGTVYWEQEYRNFEITQGLFLQKATHDFDYIMSLMNSSIVNIAAFSSKGRIFGGKKAAGLKCSECKEANICKESPKNRLRNRSGWHIEDHMCIFSKDCGNLEKGTNEDSSSVLFEFASGAQGLYTQVFYTRRNASKRGAVISGYNGTVDFDWSRRDIKCISHHSPFTETIKTDEDMGNHAGGDIELACDFIDMIKNCKIPRTTIWDGIQSVYACLAAKESSESGTFVKVRQVGNYK